MGGAGQEHQLSDAWLLDLGAPQLCWAASAGAAATPARAWHTAHMLPTEQVCPAVLLAAHCLPACSVCLLFGCALAGPRHSLLHQLQKLCQCHVNVCK